MQKRNFILSTILIFSLLLVGIYVYADEYSQKNPGHSWDEMDCDATMCVGSNVGIGTTSPGAKLEVAGGAGTRLTIGDPTDTNPTMLLGRRSGNPSIKALNASDWVIIDGGSVGLNYWQNSNVIIANGGGNVGIGDTTPDYTLDVNGNMATTIIYDKNNGSYFANPSSNSYFYSFQSATTITADTQIVSYSGQTGGIRLTRSSSSVPRISTSETVYSDGLEFYIGGGPDGVPGIFFKNSTGGNNAVLYASAKNFLIDHPLKPGMKLIHSAIEGPENAVYYRGEARLKNGKAIVKLPSYFEALTRKENRTVLLTCKDGWTPIWVEDEVRDGKFIVRTTRGGDKNQKFYWEVKAVRADIAPLKVERKASDFESK